MQRDAVGVSGHRRVLAAAAQLEYLTPAVVAGQPDQGEIAGQVVGLGPDPGGASLCVGHAVDYAAAVGRVADGLILAGQEQAVGRVRRELGPVGPCTFSTR